MQFDFCPKCGKECVSSCADGALSWVCWECGKVYRFEVIGRMIDVSEPVPPLLQKKYCDPSFVALSKDGKLIDEGVSS